MKLARWYNNRDIRIEDVPRPVPGPGEILLKILSCGICGSDIVEWYRLPRAPLVPGHEIGAQIVELGHGVDGLEVGDRVFVPPKVPCMKCKDCKEGHHPVCSVVKDRLPGGLSEYVLVPAALVEHGVYPLPEQISYDQSTFIEPLACVVRAQRLAGLRQDQTVMVMGCGMSGLMHIKVARYRCCRIVATDTQEQRRRAASEFGADIVLDAMADVPSELIKRSGRKADVIIMCTAAPPAFEQAWQCVDKGGAIIFFTVPGPDKEVTAPINDFWMKEIRMLTSYYCGPPDIAEAMDLIGSGKVGVEDMITHLLPLEDVVRGFELVMEGKDSIKVIIKPNGL